MSGWLHCETSLHWLGFQRVCGVDESGRGPLAGPVVAAAVILPYGFEPNGIADCKILTEAKRNEAYELIRSEAIDYAVGSASHLEIDKLNILQASYLAMRRAISRLSSPPDFLLVDGNHNVPDAGFLQHCLIDGDDRVLCIAAASVIAKVERDRIMREYHERFPDYGFNRHKGYPTLKHRQMIARHGPCEIHRRSFQLLPDGQNLELSL
jgi:ribonuclease HII